MPSSVIGLDLGGFATRAAKVESGGVVVLANEMSVRETPTVVSFPPSQRGVRSAGASSQPHLITQPQSSVREVRHLLGSKVLKKEYLELQEDSGDRITKDGGVELVIEGKNQVLQPEQIVASFLTHLRKTVVDPAKDKDNTNGDDFYVLSVPHYFTDGERAALLDAARIAKIKVMAVLNDLTASALAYGYFQRDLPTPSPAGIPIPDPKDSTPKQQLLTERPRLVVFVDFGYGGLRTALAEFTSAGFRVLGTAGDRQVGGRQFDERLAKFLMDKFNGQYSKQIGTKRINPLTIQTNRKAYAKLLTAAEKTKRLLSANKERVPVNLECLHNDLDLSTNICRQEFEELCGDLFERVRGCLSELIMKVPDLDIKDLHSVEVIGGSSRIPKFKSIIEEIFGITPSTTLHATESTAKGCALMCAALTRIYGVKPFQILDLVTPYPVQLKYTPTLKEVNNSEDVSKSALIPKPEVITHPVFHSHDSKFNEVVLLQGRPQGDTVAIEYDDTSCNLLKQTLIAIYQLQFTGNDVSIGKNDDLVLQICIQNGMPRLRRCKWIKRDDNEEETEVDVRFTETRVGGLSERDLVDYIHTEENMQRSDYEEQKRQEIKNSLEENTYQFRDELSSGDDGIKEQKAWKDCMSFVSDIQNQIDNDEMYETRTEGAYVKLLEAVNEKFLAYRKWKEDYMKYLQNKKVQQINKNDSNPGFVRSRDRKNNSRVAPDYADSMSSRPYSPLFSPFVPSHQRQFIPEYLGNQYCYTPRSSFLSWF